MFSNNVSIDIINYPFTFLKMKDNLKQLMNVTVIKEQSVNMMTLCVKTNHLHGYHLKKRLFAQRFLRTFLDMFSWRKTKPSSCRAIRRTTHFSRKMCTILYWFGNILLLISCIVIDDTWITFSQSYFRTLIMRFVVTIFLVKCVAFIFTIENILIILFNVW